MTEKQGRILELIDSLSPEFDALCTGGFDIGDWGVTRSLEKKGLIERSFPACCGECTCDRYPAPWMGQEFWGLKLTEQGQAQLERTK